MIAILWILALSGTAVTAAPSAWFYSELDCTTPDGRTNNPEYGDWSKELTIGRKKCWKNENSWDPEGARRRAVWINKRGNKDKGCLWLYDDVQCLNVPDVMEFTPNDHLSSCWNYDLGDVGVGYGSYAFTEEGCPPSGSEYRKLLPNEKVILMST